MANRSLPDVEAWRINPLIQHSPTDTMQAALCAVKALARVHSDRADLGPPEALSEDETRGLGYMCECIASALQYELGGRAAS
jgi:hypothetical protein